MQRNRGGAGVSGADIEVTPEMAKAGGRLVAGFDPNTENPREIATHVYRVMEKIRRESCVPGEPLAQE